MKRVFFLVSCIALVVLTGCKEEVPTSVDVHQVESFTAQAGDGEVMLFWEPAEGSNPAGYFLTWTASAAEVEGGERNFGTEVTSATIKGLVNGEMYTFNIQPEYGSNGRGGRVSTTVRPLSSRPAPTNFMAIPDDKSVNLVWTKPTNENFTGYVLTISPGNQEITISKDLVEYEVTDLVNETEYEFSLYAVYPTGNSDVVQTKATPNSEPLAYLWDAVNLKADDLSGFVKVSNPVFSPDGNTIYLPTSDPAGHVFAIDRVTGIIKWVSEISVVTYGGGAVVDPEGVIYQCGTDRRVYALNPDDGSKKWTAEVDAVIGAFPALSTDGVLYCVSNGTKLYAINTTNGNIMWERELTGNTGGAVALDASGAVYVGTNTGIWKFSATGEQIWNTTGINVTERGAFAINGNTLYAALKSNGGLVAVNMDTGDILWLFNDVLGTNDSYFPMVGVDGTIFFTNRGTANTEADGNLFAINPNGTLKWQRHLGSRPTYSGLVLSDKGIIYCGTQTRVAPNPWKLYGINAATGAIVFEYDSNEQLLAGTMIGPDQRLYLGTIGSSPANGGRLLAIPIESNLDTSAPWSSMRGSNIYGTNRQQ